MSPSLGLCRVLIFPWCFQAEDPDTELTLYNDTVLRVIAGFVKCVVAALFPAASMLVLQTIRNLGVKLVLIVVLLCLFTGALALCTRARAIEVFMATVA